MLSTLFGLRDMNFLEKVLPLLRFLASLINMAWVGSLEVKDSTLCIFLLSSVSLCRDGEVIKVVCTVSAIAGIVTRILAFTVCLVSYST